MRILQRVIFLSVILCGVAAISKAAPQTQGAPPSKGFTIEQVLSFSFPETTSMVASPTGDRVAWVANTKGLRNIWGAEAPGWTARQITHYAMDDGQEIGDLEFSGMAGCSSTFAAATKIARVSCRIRKQSGGCGSIRCGR